MIEPKPSEWHRCPPRRHKCPICGCRASNKKLHRRIDIPGQLPTFVNRVKTPNGYRESPITVCVQPTRSTAVDDDLEPAATDWHKRPANSEGPCSVCGFPQAKFRGLHRRVDDPGSQSLRFLKRTKSQGGWQEVCIEVEPPGSQAPKRSIKQRRGRTGPTRRTRERIAAAVRMRVFQGKNNAEIGEALGVTRNAVELWRRIYRQLWQAAEAELSADIVKLVRSQVGTDAILEDVDLYLHRANLADKWVKQQGEELFTIGSEPTLTSFYRSFYLPVCLSDAAQETKDLYETILRNWRLVTGDPPLAEITVELLAKYKEVASKSRGLQSCNRASPNTVAGKLRHIQTLLDKAGPPDRRNRDAAGIIEKVPWVRPPRTESRPVIVVEPDVLNAVYAASVGMEKPWIGSMKPAKWWRALLVVAFNTGLRRKTLFRLRWDWIDWQGKVIKIPREAMKAGRAHVCPLNAPTAEHLHAIHDERELVFPWPYHKRTFSSNWHELLDLAGIPKEEHFGLHNLRKTLATTLWESNPQAPQLTLSHADSAVTRNHYVEQNRIIAAAIDALPQPEAFTQGIGRSA